MNSLKIFLPEANRVLPEANRAWELNSEQEYVVGNSQDCRISLDLVDPLPEFKLNFHYDTSTSLWCLGLLSGDPYSIKIDNQPLSTYFIKQQTQISVFDSVYLMVIPEGISLASSPQNSQQTHLKNALNPKQESIIATGVDSLQSPEYRFPPLARQINLGNRIIKMDSPNDGAGFELKSYRLLKTYSTNREKVKRVCLKLNNYVIEKIRDGCVSDSKVMAFIYVKKTVDGRSYIRVTRETIHGVRVTAFIRFSGYGDNLYVGMNAYSLGDFDWKRFLIKLSISLVLSLLFILPPLGYSFYNTFVGLTSSPELLVDLDFISYLLSSAFSNLMVAIIPILVFALMWWKMAWRFNDEKRFLLALKQEFPKPYIGDLFDIDDITMFVQSTTRVAAQAIYDVFEEEGLPLEELGEYIQQINYITNVDTQGGDIVQSSVGTANKVISN